MELKYNAFLRLGELEDLFQDLEDGLTCGSFIAMNGGYNWLNNVVDYTKSLRAYIRTTGDEEILSRLKKLNKTIYLKYAYESNYKLYDKLVYIHKFLLEICADEEEKKRGEEVKKRDNEIFLRDRDKLEKIFNNIALLPPPPPPMAGTGGEPILLTLDMLRREQAHRATQENTGRAVNDLLTDEEGKLLKLPVEGLSERARNNLKPVEGDLLRILNNGIKEGYFKLCNGVIKYFITLGDLAILINGIAYNLKIPVSSLGGLWGIEGKKINNIVYKWYGGVQSAAIYERRKKQAEIITR